MIYAAVEVTHDVEHTVCVVECVNLNECFSFQTFSAMNFKGTGAQARAVLYIVLASPMHLG